MGVDNYYLSPIASILRIPASFAIRYQHSLCDKPNCHLPPIFILSSTPPAIPSVTPPFLLVSLCLLLAAVTLSIAIMPTPFKFTVSLDVPREFIWRIRASKTFMQFLVTNGALGRMEATAPTTPEDASSATMKTRRQTYVAGDVTIPDMIKPLLDDSYIEVSDIQTWDEAIPYLQHSTIHPTILGDVISTTACLSLHVDKSHHFRDDAHHEEDHVCDCPTSDDDTSADDLLVEHACLHTLSGSVAVSVPFLGYFVEQAVVTNMKQFYSEYSTHVHAFFDMAMQKYGDGTRASLSSAIDRILIEEAKLSL